MFFVLGTKMKHKPVEGGVVVPGGCPHCRHDLHEEMICEYFSAFFMPIFPISKPKTILSCNNCGFMRLPYEGEIPGM